MSVQKQRLFKKGVYKLDKPYVNIVYLRAFTNFSM